MTFDFRRKAASGCFIRAPTTVKKIGKHFMDIEFVLLAAHWKRLTMGKVEEMDGAVSRCSGRNKSYADRKAKKHLPSARYIAN